MMAWSVRLSVHHTHPIFQQLTPRLIRDSVKNPTLPLSLSLGRAVRVNQKAAVSA
jgi:hypothetical protein